MDRAEGLKEIDEAKWCVDEYRTLNLYVTDKEGHKVHSFLTLRPTYCDRGHIQLNIDGRFGLDQADSFPRYFFSFKEADDHTRRFLKWRIWKHSTRVNWDLELTHLLGLRT